MIRNIILDMGNVLLDFNPDVILDKVCDNEEEKTILYQQLFKGPEWIMGDYGQITNSERYELVKERVPSHLHHKLKQCVDNWDVCMVPIEGAKEFCKRVKEKGYKVFVLSNACSKFYEYFPKEYDLDFFDGVVVSSDVHIIKPDKEIYEYIIEKYNLVASECLFIDDREENVEGARSVGMEAIVFANNYLQIMDSRLKYVLAE